MRVGGFGVRVGRTGLGVSVGVGGTSVTVDDCIGTLVLVSKSRILEKICCSGVSVGSSDTSVTVGFVGAMVLVVVSESRIPEKICGTGVCVSSGVYVGAMVLVALPWNVVTLGGSCGILGCSASTDWRISTVTRSTTTSRSSTPPPPATQGSHLLVAALVPAEAGGRNDWIGCSIGAIPAACRLAPKLIASAGRSSGLSAITCMSAAPSFGESCGFKA